MSKIVIALGGNALGKEPKEQLDLLKGVAKIIVNLVKEGNSIVLTHGNGPQVGQILLAMDYSANGDAGTPSMPFAECGSMSQGYIGYHLQQCLQEELNKQGIKKDCATIVTQVLVDLNDKAFENPTKPIDIIEKGIISKLVDDDNLVIAVGGGGIPVVRGENGLEGVAAVIDKDRSAALLAREINADMLLILTAVDKVFINYNTPNQMALDELTIEEANSYIESGHFAKGSMLPKVEACMEFVKGNAGKKAIIGSLEKASEAINGTSGTVIKG